jgi:hypothetical protein
MIASARASRRQALLPGRQALRLVRR